jgi:hypothetical protein
VFHVIGGVWKSTEWAEVDDLEHYGPFADFNEAKDCWRGHAQAKVDDAHHRLFIVEPVTDPKTFLPVFPVGTTQIEIDWME